MARRSQDPGSTAPKPHPIERFTAPSAIETGSPLKHLFDSQYVKLLAESIAAVHPGFQSRRFQRSAMAGLDGLELVPRAQHLAAALIAEFPESPSRRAEILTAALGPELSATDGNGLRPFFYMPHSQAVATGCVDDFESGMRANHELTRRFTAEFSVRPFIIRFPDKSLALLETWTRDPNPHVRRLVSEGTRPRLPWAMRLKAIQSDPGLTLPLLEALKDDSVLYVRRSVANHVADVLKDHPEFAYSLCERWLREVMRKSVTAGVRSSRFWMIRHAVRLPAKKGDERALDLRQRAR